MTTTMILTTIMNMAIRHLPVEQRELTAVLVRTSSPAASIQLPNLINEGSVAQAVMPVREIRGLFDVIVGPIETVLLALTGLIVAGFGSGHPGQHLQFDE